MLPRILKLKKSFSAYFQYGMGSLLSLISTPLFAQDPPPIQNLTPGSDTPVNAESMLMNFAQNIPSLMALLTGVAYVIGMYFIITGVLKLKHFGEQRSMYSQEHSMKGPIVFLTIGALLLYLPTSVQIGMSTFWTDPNPYGYLAQQDEWASLINDCFLIIQFIGALSFVRGLVVLSAIGGHGGQQGTVSKGLMQVIGGIFCINIYQFVQMVLATLGVPFSF